MTGRERVRTALDFRQPDRVPVDFGGCAQTTIHVGVIAKLREYYGLEKRLVKVEEPYTMMGRLDEDLKSVIGTDVDNFTPLYSFFGVARENWKEYVMQDGLKVLAPGDFNVTVDGQGKTWMYPQGDASVPASAVMPKDGYYFDAVMRQEPLDEDNLRVEDNLEEFTDITDGELDFLKKQSAANLKTGRALFGVIPGAGLGDIACVPAPWMKHPKGIRGIEEWYMATAARQDFLHELFGRQTDIVLRNLEKIKKAVGDAMDVAWVCGTDFGTQNSTFCSPKTFHELYKPYYQKVNSWIHKNTGWKTFKHCCGSIPNFMDAFIEAGFDIMNPVQWTAKGMEPKLLKKEFGGRITFWGGGVDTQKTLPFGTPSQVREEVLHNCDIFAPGGGFVFNTIHNIQAKTPIENIVAMLEALKDFNGAKLI